MNIYEVLDYGPIVAKDEDYGWLLTVNGAYFNLWVDNGNGWANVEAYDMRSRVKADNDQSSGLYGTQTTDVMDAGQELVEKIREELDEEAAEWDMQHDN